MTQPMDKSVYLSFKKVYLQLKLLCERARRWEATTIQDLNEIADGEKQLDEDWKLIEEKFKSV